MLLPIMSVGLSHSLIIFFSYFHSVARSPLLPSPSLLGIALLLCSFCYLLFFCSSAILTLLLRIRLRLLRLHLRVLLSSSTFTDPVRSPRLVLAHLAL